MFCFLLAQKVVKCQHFVWMVRVLKTNKQIPKQSCNNISLTTNCMSYYQIRQYLFIEDCGAYLQHTLYATRFIKISILDKKHLMCTCRPTLILMS